MTTKFHAQQALLKTKFFPYWLDNSSAPETEPALTQNIKCDLLIVGAGVTGLWAAIHAKEADPERDVVIIESQCVAIGAKITMYALDTLDEKGGWRKPWVKMVEKMGFPVTQSEQ